MKISLMTKENRVLGKMNKMFLWWNIIRNKYELWKWLTPNEKILEEMSGAGEQNELVKTKDEDSWYI